LSAFTLTVISTYGFVAELVAWQIVIFCGAGFGVCVAPAELRCELLWLERLDELGCAGVAACNSEPLLWPGALAELPCDGVAGCAGVAGVAGRAWCFFTWPGAWFDLPGWSDWPGGTGCAGCAGVAGWADP
jgi:hypothetical protein